MAPTPGARPRTLFPFDARHYRSFQALGHRGLRA